MCHSCQLDSGFSDYDIDKEQGFLHQRSTSEWQEHGLALCVRTSDSHSSVSRTRGPCTEVARLEALFGVMAIMVLR